MAEAVNRTEIDGVPVFWVQAPGPLTGFLTFRAGVCDESFETLGLTHLLEHLAFSRLPPVRHEHNGRVGVGITNFSATGRPESVAATLTDICASLAAVAAGDLDPGLVETEKDVIGAEGGLPLPPAHGEALVHRFGLRGPGLAGASPHFLDRLGPQDLAAHAADYFTRANAVLALTGPPPPDLRLPLPDGGRRPVPDDAEPLGIRPGEYVSGTDQLVLSFESPGADSRLSYVQGLLAHALRRRAHAALRRNAGLLYDLDVAGAATAPGRGVTIITVELKPANAIRVAREILSILRGLRDHGVAAEELDDAIVAARESGQGPGAAVEDAQDAAISHLVQLPAWPHAACVAALEGHTPADMGAFLSRLEETLLVGLPEEAVPAEAGEASALMFPPLRHVPADLPPGTGHKRSLIGAFAGVPRDARLEIGDAGVAFCAEGEREAYRWEDIAAIEWGDAEEAGESATIIGRDGFQIHILAVWFRRGREAFADLRRRVPERLQYREAAQGAGNVPA
ncbi:hypothetical protein NCCP1664_09780 [Zafaria cholistanensis]|uniref:Peptidase M16 C-terminal domain-containing protein n=1 Tax=Zafaria cholistanensis TaxID=1682741 RepID=A0A5A7NRU9_9MICC|nr:insulinase family protein [Zafaria cholistanensis]GER22481.1 hypothetical protein NCCP1664_09780 [Zafaria cholistanensis]